METLNGGLASGAFHPDKTKTPGAASDSVVDELNGVNPAEPRKNGH
jgi:hypothetical protein